MLSLRPTTFATLALLGLASLPETAHAKPNEFSAPVGQLGAGLTTDSAQRGRLYADLAFFTTHPFASDIFALSTVLGFGYKLADRVEIEANLPIGSVFGSGGGAGYDRFAVGNLALGVNYFTVEDNLLFKVGGGLAYGPWNSDPSLEDFVVHAYSASVRGYETIWHWAPSTLTLYVPARLEYGEQLRFTADASLGLLLPTNSGDTDFIANLAPGFSYRATPEFSFGARLPIYWMPTATDNAQLALEPYLRAHLKNSFLSTRFTMNLDEPLGFSFDTGRFWGLQLAFGANF